MFAFTPGCCCRSCRVVVERSPIGLRLTLDGLEDGEPKEDHLNSKGASALNKEFAFRDIWTWGVGSWDLLQCQGTEKGDCCSGDVISQVWGEEAFSPCSEVTTEWTWTIYVVDASLDPPWHQVGFAQWEMDSEVSCGGPEYRAKYFCDTPSYPTEVGTPALYDLTELDIGTHKTELKITQHCTGSPRAREPFIYVGLDETVFGVYTWLIGLEIGYSPKNRRRWIKARIGLLTTMGTYGAAVWAYEEAGSGPFTALDLDNQSLTLDGEIPDDWPGDWSGVTLAVSGYRPE